MNEVRKWYIGVYGGEAQARPCSPAEFEIINEREGRYFVLKEDFDRVTAERDALQQRLTAADVRADDLSSAATKALEVLRSLLKMNACGMHYAAAQMACHQLSAALKPGNS